MARIGSAKPVLLLLAICAGSCDDPPLSSSLTRSGTSPTSVVNLTGRWTGTALDSTGRVEMVWQLTHRGSDVTGSVTAATNVGLPVYTGAVEGTLSSGTLRFTLTVPAGAIVELPDCALDLAGTATDVLANSIAGTYAGVHSCLGTVEAGRFLFNRQ